MVTKTAKKTPKKWTKAEFQKAQKARVQRQKMLTKVIADLENLRGKVSIALTTLRMLTKGSLDPIPFPPADGPSLKKVPVVK